MKAILDARKNSTWQELDTFLIDLEANIRQLQKTTTKNHQVIPIDAESIATSINEFLNEEEIWSSQLLRKLKVSLGEWQAHVDEGAVQLHLAHMNGRDELDKNIQRINRLNNDLSALILHSKNELRNSLEAFQRSFIELKLWLSKLNHA